MVATFGIPETVVTDNGSNFTSVEFENFLKSNVIHHIKAAPYHPASNGLAERAVQTFKSGMRKLTDGTLETRVARFLFNYRITPQTNVDLIFSIVTDEVVEVVICTSIHFECASTRIAEKGASKIGMNPDPWFLGPLPGVQHSLWWFTSKLLRSSTVPHFILQI